MKTGRGARRNGYGCGMRRRSKSRLADTIVAQPTPFCLTLTSAEVNARTRARRARDHSRNGDARGQQPTRAGSSRFCNDHCRRAIECFFDRFELTA
jgi:hypothetical protein